MDVDRFLAPDLAQAESMVIDGVLLDAAEKAVGTLS
jgi:hypothetical protein